MRNKEPNNDLINMWVVIVAKLDKNGEIVSKYYFSVHRKVSVLTYPLHGAEPFLSS